MTKVIKGERVIVTADEGKKLACISEKLICSELTTAKSHVDSILSNYTEIIEFEAEELQEQWNLEDQNSTSSGEE